MPAATKNKTVMTKTILVFLLSSMFVPISAFCQSENETITIRTYYPSPYGIYRNLEVKGKMAIGDVSAKIAGGDVSDLRQEQLYVGDSILLGNQPGDPATGLEGELIYNEAAHMLKFRNDTGWVEATGFPACAINTQCQACTGSPSPWCFNKCPTGLVCPACQTAGQRCYAQCAQNAVCGACPAATPRCYAQCATNGNCPACQVAGQQCKPSDYIDPDDCPPTSCPQCPGACQSGYSCQPITTVVNGVCGSSNGLTLSSAPSSGLCNAGTASAVSGSGPWTWSCDGLNGGGTASCFANAVAVAWLMNRQHTEDQCRSAGGSVMYNQCRFDGNTCSSIGLSTPPAWLPTGFTETSQYHCVKSNIAMPPYDGPTYQNGPGTCPGNLASATTFGNPWYYYCCNTGFHALGTQAQETCVYCASTGTCQGDCVCNYATTCTSPVTGIGCY